MSGPKIFTSSYYERLSALEAVGWWHAAMRDILAAVTDNGRLPEKGVLVDIGCGAGETLNWFVRRHPKWAVAGIDAAMHGLRAVPSLPQGRLVQGSALELPLPTGCADFVVSLDVLQHLPLDGGDVRALIEMRRILKPGGLLFLRTNAQSIPRTADDDLHLFHRYDTEELRKKLVSAGLVVERLGRVNALLGLAEIPREWRALRRTGRSYHGVLAPAPVRPAISDRWKRLWLSTEGRLALRGWSLPFGRTHVAVCRPNGNEQYSGALPDEGQTDVRSA